MGKYQKNIEAARRITVMPYSPNNRRTFTATLPP